MKKIEEIANSFIEDIRYDINFNNVKYYIENHGWKVIQYDSDNGYSLKMFGLEDDLIEKSKNKNGFTHYGEYVKGIFINKSISDKLKLITLLHEIGHIELKHNTSFSDDSMLELEADTFVKCVLVSLNNANSTSNKNNKKIKPNKIVVGVIVAVVLCITSSFYQLSANNPNDITVDIPADVSTQGSTQSVYNVAETVYVTQTGTKYHKSTCQHIKSRETRSISLSEAKKSYSPCKTCWQ